MTKERLRAHIGFAEDAAADISYVAARCGEHLYFDRDHIVAAGARNYLAQNHQDDRGRKEAQRLIQLAQDTKYRR